MAGINGTQPDSDTLLLIKEYGVCNFIIFDRNLYDGRDKLKRLVDDLRRICTEEGLPSPVFAVDQEGGTVQRLRPPEWPEIVSNRVAANSDDPATSVMEQAEAAAEMLADAGIDLNLAPVLDLSGVACDGVLRGRTYSSDPTVAGELGKLYISTLQSKGIGATAKHFPGICRVLQDPHDKRPVVTAPEDLVISEAAPFREAISAGTKAIMTSHVVYTGLDGKEPATFSQKISTDLLKDKFCFKGILITDDLEMGGILEHDSIGNAAVKAVTAGHDIALVCHKTSRVIEAVKALEKGVENGVVDSKRIVDAAFRIDEFRRWRFSSDS